MTDRQTRSVNKQALTDLLGKVEAGEIHPAQHWMIHAVFGEWAGEHRTIHLVKAIMANSIEALGAAKALHEAVLPDWEWNIDAGDGAYVEYRADSSVDWYTGDVVKNPASAWLIAILKALIAKGGE